MSIHRHRREAVSVAMHTLLERFDSSTIKLPVKAPFKSPVESTKWERHQTGTILKAIRSNSRGKNLKNAEHQLQWTDYNES